MRIRSIPGAVREIRQVDSATAVNEGMLRELIERGEIISESVGAKTVVDVDTVIEVLCRMSGCGQGSVPHIRTIRETMRQGRDACVRAGLSRDRVRECVEEQIVPSIQVGNRSYIALELLEEPNIRLFYAFDRKSKRIKRTASANAIAQVKAILEEKTAIPVVRRRV